MIFKGGFFMNSVADIWASVLEIMENELMLSKTTIKTWFSDIKAVSLSGDTLLLVTPQEFKKPIILNNHSKTIESALDTLFSAPIKFTLLTEAEYKATEKKAEPSVFDADEFSFERFVVGESNKFAHAAAKAVAASPGLSYNPLLIYGGSGLGKTHLLYAIARTVKEQNPNKKIVYVKSEEFTNDLIQALGQGSLPALREKYRKADVLLVDDIQFIAGKNSTQEEFFHTFNALVEAKKQIVLTSDRRPKEMATLEERLQSRFESGLIADIQPPDFETRMAIISLKASRLGLSLTTAQKEIIANNVTANVRQLEGTVNKLRAYRELLSKDINLEITENAIKDIFKENPWINPTPDFIIKAVAKYFETDPSLLLGKNNSEKIVMPRQIAMYIVRDMVGLSYPKIGEIFKKDHSTVMHAIKKLNDLMEKDDALKTQIQDVKNSILEP